MILEIHSFNDVESTDVDKIKRILGESLNPNDSLNNEFDDRFVCMDKTVDRVRVFLDSYFRGSHIYTFKDVDVACA